mmetsp:Transcript_4948/g.7502  ORF Transcript_4948/g.7502 Transcript_4948/m.7502 type:complete len:210 (+) Transcript_4948:170-799(+)
MILLTWLAKTSGTPLKKPPLVSCESPKSSTAVLPCLPSLDTLSMPTASPGLGPWNLTELLSPRLIPPLKHGMPFLMLPSFKSFPLLDSLNTGVRLTLRSITWLVESPVNSPLSMPSTFLDPLLTFTILSASPTQRLKNKRPTDLSRRSITDVLLCLVSSVSSVKLRSKDPFLLLRESSPLTMENSWLLLPRVSFPQLAFPKYSYRKLAF